MTTRKKIQDIAPNDRFRGYTDCLSPSSHYKYFADWFSRYSYEATRRGSDRAKPARTLLDAVTRAIDIVLKPSGWCGVEWDFVEDTTAAHHAVYGRLPVDLLSDGIRNMIGLVADIAHRAARSNPHLGSDAALKTPGIVLIDEVDMHLHPQWQQTVLQSLAEAFPLIQFIVTTHSPQVLTTVRKEKIRVLIEEEYGQWSAKIPDRSPLAHEAGDALALIMGTHPRPDIQGLLTDIHQYETLAKAGKATSVEALKIHRHLTDAGFEFNDAEKRLFEILAARHDKKA